MLAESLGKHVPPKTTLAGFRMRIDQKPQEPKRLTREAYDLLGEAERIAYNDQRLLWLGDQLWIKTPGTIDLVKAIRSNLRMRDALSENQSGIVLMGPAFIGKSTANMRAARGVEDQVRRMRPDYRKDGIVPVVYIEIPPNATPKTVAMQVIKFFDIPYNARTSASPELMRIAVDLLQQRQTKVLFIDELQMLNLEGRTGDAAINTLRTLMNSTSALCVFSGIDLTKRLVSIPAKQIMARCDVLRLDPYTASHDDQRQEWAQFVRAFGEGMNLLDSGPDPLGPFIDRLLHTTGGSIGALRQTLSHALGLIIANTEYGEGPEVVTNEIIESSTRFSLRAS